jgi:hypothetical protein
MGWVWFNNQSASWGFAAFVPYWRNDSIALGMAIQKRNSRFCAKYFHWHCTYLIHPGNSPEFHSAE